MDEANLAMLILRLAAGLTLAAHGFNKFRGGLAGVGAWFDSMGMRPGRLHATFAAAGEVAAGLFLAAGLLTTFAALGFVGLMTVAAYTVHIRHGFFILDEGWEYVFILAVVAVTIAVLGPGAWSVDDALGDRRRSRRLCRPGDLRRWRGRRRRRTARRVLPTAAAGRHLVRGGRTVISAGATPRWPSDDPPG